MMIDSSASLVSPHHRRTPWISTILILLVGCGGSPARQQPPQVQGYVSIPPGEFMMGTPEDEPNRDPEEVLHPVRISRPFLLKATEVTRAEWGEIMGDLLNGQGDPSCDGERCPVTLVSWFDILVYMNRLSRTEGLEECYEMSDCAGTPGTGCRGLSPLEEQAQECDGDFRCEKVHFRGLDCAGYRLPTEAEWEYAARAGTSTPFATGPCITPGEASINFSQPVDGCPVVNQLPSFVMVGQFPPNPWGLHDMSGSVFEYVWDRKTSYPSDMVTDPEGDDSSTEHVVRGGSWAFPMRWARSGCRSAMLPSTRSNQDGFRTARTLPAPTFAP